MTEENDWVSDVAIAEIVGDWWIDDMDLSGGYDFEQSKLAILKLANKEFAEHGCAFRVVDVRDGGDYLEWKMKK